MLKHLRLCLQREHFCSTTLELQATEKKSTDNHPNKAREGQMCTKACWKLLKSWEWMKNLLFKPALCHYYHSMHIIAKIMFSNRFLRYSHHICHWPVKQIVPPLNSLHWLSQKLTCRATQTNLFRSSGSQTTDHRLEKLQWLKTHSIHFLWLWHNVWHLSLTGIGDSKAVGRLDVVDVWNQVEWGFRGVWTRVVEKYGQAESCILLIRVSYKQPTWKEWEEERMSDCNEERKEKEVLMFFKGIVHPKMENSVLISAFLSL